MRTGPRPLSVQIGMATAYWPHNFAAPEAMQQDIPQNMPKSIEDMLLGIRKYRMHEFRRPDMALEEIWRAGEVSIQRIPEHDYRAENEEIILIPSLINKAYILDLLPDRSLLRFLAQQNLNPYLLDWGESSVDEEQSDIDSLMRDRLVPALNFVHERENKQIHALGYCMGGTLLLGAAYQKPKMFKSLVMLAAPWDFHAGNQGLLNCVKFWSPSALPMMDEKGILPVDWVQTVFASLDPSVAVKKFARFAQMEEGTEAEALFVAVEDWLNDGVNLPAPLGQHCIMDWFLKNEPGLGQWQIHGEAVDLSQITCPTLVIASHKDRLVEYDTAAAVEAIMPNTELLDPACGHIGMIAGQNSIQDVWKPLADWLQK